MLTMFYCTTQFAKFVKTHNILSSYNITSILRLVQDYCKGFGHYEIIAKEAKLLRKAAKEAKLLQKKQKNCEIIAKLLRKQQHKDQCSRAEINAIF